MSKKQEKQEGDGEEQSEECGNECKDFKCSRNCHENQEKFEQAEKQADEYKELLQRLQADFENYKKRCEKQMGEIREHSKQEAIAKLLPVLDSFELALKSMQASEKNTQGVKMIFSQLHSALEGLGLKKIDCTGKAFDPYRHEALLTAESEQDGIILEELQTGYMLNDAVIRHSKVKIGKKGKTEA